MVNSQEALLWRLGRRLMTPALRHTLQPAVARYLREPRTYRGFGLLLRVPPGVFHPRWFFSSQVMAQWLSARDLRGRRLLDLGTGSGLLGLVAARHGAQVTLLDISAAALMAAHANAARNGLKVEMLHSDGFRNVRPERRWDWIVANPPWFPHAPDDPSEHAWRAGPELQWFSHFFRSLDHRLNRGGRAVMVLADSADIPRIRAIAHDHRRELVVVQTRRVWWERQHVIEVRGG